MAANSLVGIKGDAICKAQPPPDPLPSTAQSTDPPPSQFFQALSGHEILALLDAAGYPSATTTSRPNTIQLRITLRKLVGAQVGKVRASKSKPFVSSGRKGAGVLRPIQLDGDGNVPAERAGEIAPGVQYEVKRGRGGRNVAYPMHCRRQGSPRDSAPKRSCNESLWC